VTLDAYADYHKDPKAWLANQSNIDKVVKLSGAKAADIPLLLQGNVYPLAADQVVLLGAPTTKAVTDTAAFLKEQRQGRCRTAGLRPVRSAPVHNQLLRSSSRWPCYTGAHQRTVPRRR
jgi:hypothetical protein